MSLAVDLLTSALRLKGPQRPSRWQDHAVAAWLMTLGAVAIALAVRMMPPECGAEDQALPAHCLFPYVLGLGPFFGLPFIPIAILALWGLRDSNFGGYLAAVLIGVVLAVIGGRFISSAGPMMPISAASGAIYGLLYWTVLFLRCRLPDPEQ